MHHSVGDSDFLTVRKLNKYAIINDIHEGNRINSRTMASKVGPVYVYPNLPVALLIIWFNWRSSSSQLRPVCKIAIDLWQLVGYELKSDNVLFVFLECYAQYLSTTPSCFRLQLKHSTTSRIGR